MSTTEPPKKSAAWIGDAVPRGKRDTRSIVISESYLGADVSIPVHIWHAKAKGPTVLITSAVHGDEINGTGAIRNLIRRPPFELSKGTLALVPVVNPFGFERHSRYLPDRRDLNRSFPGSKTGSHAARLARSLFDQLVAHADFCIDLHTAAIRRTNFPNVRADMTDPTLAAFARAFGAELIVHGKGPDGSLRSAACKAGCPTIILEAGEIWKVEPTVLEYATRGITNCLKHLGMVEGSPEAPPYQVEADATTWIRARFGGFLEFHIAPGDIIRKGQPLATNTTLTGEDQNVITAPRDAIVLGMTTIPSAAPGDPICHLAYPTNDSLDTVQQLVDRLSDLSLHERARGDLATNLSVEEHRED